MKKLLYLLAVGCVLLIVGCARMGNPDGGWFDDTPPYVISSTPEDKETNVTGRRVTIHFNEFIKLEDAQSKVVISPPQLEQADVKANGKRIIVSLKDTLIANTTYTIDFSDAISDHTEGNPMGNYTFSFSTGDHIDTLEVSGYVLDAKNLEPIKGIAVGLYNDLSDTAFLKKPMVRISRTDSRGHFIVRGVAPGTYRAYALQDTGDDFIYNQKSEMIAFSHDTFEPSWKPDIRQDTIWRDSLHIDNIIRIPYTHFLPDDITLLAFTAVQDDRYLLKTERQEPNKLGMYFTYGDSVPPTIRGLNFNSDSAFVIEASPKNDTIYYWVRDTMLVNQDTLQIEAQYMMTDTTGMMISKTDTLEFLPKTSYEKRLKAKQKEMEKWLKEQEKKKKNDQPYDSVMPKQWLQLKISPSGAIDPESRVIIESPTPLAKFDTAAVHLYTKIDSLWYDADFCLKPIPHHIRSYVVEANWKEETEYSLEIDSAAIEDIYGLTIQETKVGIKVKSEDEFSTIIFNVSGLNTNDGPIIAELLNTTDAVTKQVKANGNTVEFYYVKPGKYYVRAFVDSNDNGVWDTGDYYADRQAEAVYYYPKEVECKAKWDVTLPWNVNEQPRFKQKPAAITKQKPDKEKKLQNRNAQRAKELGKQYIQKTTGVRL